MILSFRPIRLLIAAILMIGVAFDASVFVELLMAVGMDERVARIAGSRLSVMSALVGAGLLLIAISIWARNSRMHSISLGHADLLDHLAQEHLGHVEIVAGVGAGFAGEVAGLRVEIIIEPTRGGQAWIRALCPAARPIHIWPRGLVPDTEGSNGYRIAIGPSWEAWSSSNEALHGDVVHPIEDAFYVGGVGEIRHNRNGIELSMSNAPGVDLMERISVGLKAAAALSRVNR